MKLLRIYGKHFGELKGYISDHKMVDIVGCGDIHNFRPFPIFKQADTIFLRGCDKNFVFYWLTPTIFPSVKNIYLSSHPCDPQVLNRTWKRGTKLYLDESYSGYKTRWAEYRDSVILVNKKQIDEALAQHHEIEEKGII